MAADQIRFLPLADVMDRGAELYAQAGEDEGSAKAAIASWSALRGDRPKAVKRTIEDIEQAGGGWTFAKLTIANAALRELSAAA